MISKKKKFIKDIIINTLATGLAIVALQFAIFPLLGSKLSEDDFGLFLAIISLINILGATFGNVLNNIRLISTEEHDQSELVSNLNGILIIITSLNIIMTILFSIILFSGLTYIDILLITIVSFTLLLVRYYVVEFRIKLMFNMILLNSIFMIIGYFTGYLLFLLTDYWQMTYLFANIFSLLHVFYVIKPSLVSKKTKIFSKLGLNYIILLGSGFLLSLTTYIDKILIFPLLGGAAVSIYYTSTLMGKVLNLIVSPITNVLLTYLSIRSKRILRNFITLLVISFLMGIIIYIFLVLFGDFILAILYPQFYELAKEYIFITTLTALFVSVSAFANTFLLKFLKIKWQLIIDFVYLCAYLIFSLLLLNKWDLYGFALGILIASVIKIILQILVFILIMKGSRIKSNMNDILLIEDSIDSGN